MRDDQRAMLEDMREKTLDNAIEEFDAACGLRLTEKEERGDRRWLTMMASSSIKLHREIAALLDGKKPSGEDDDDEARKVQMLIDEAAGKVARFEQRKG